MCTVFNYFVCVHVLTVFGSDNYRWHNEETRLFFSSGFSILNRLFALAVSLGHN